MRFEGNMGQSLSELRLSRSFYQGRKTDIAVIHYHLLESNRKIDVTNAQLI